MFVTSLPTRFKRNAFGALQANTKRPKTQSTPQEGPSGHNKNGREQVDEYGNSGNITMTDEDWEDIDNIVARALDNNVARALQRSFQNKLVEAEQEITEHAAACSMYDAVYETLGFVQHVQGGNTTKNYLSPLSCSAVRNDVFSLEGEDDSSQDHYKPTGGSVVPGFLPVQ
jgi:hypothetical protein